MFSVFQFLQGRLYRIRNYIWNYPELLFIQEGSLAQRLKVIYLDARPFSHLMVLLLIIVAIASSIPQNVRAFLQIETDTLTEGVIVGVDENGSLRTLNRISPLIVTNIQLEKDLSELIYESLVRVDQNGDIIPVLVEDFSVNSEQTVYRFNLKQGIYWQDGELFDVDDVQQTFALLKRLENRASTSTFFSRAAVKIDFNKIDQFTFELAFKENAVIPSFFEAISFKILPAHLLNNVSPVNILSSDPVINRIPIGTGPFQLVASDENSITLVRNDNYREPVKLKRIKFKLFANEESALTAIRAGQIHAISGLSVDSLKQIQNNPMLSIISSNTIYNQYWGLYFNLDSNQGPPIFKNKRVRQAISSAINRQRVIDSLLGFAEEAKGSIPSNSFYWTDVKRYDYDKQIAIEILDKNGWVYNEESGVREKDGKVLEFELLLVNNTDRLKIAEVIKQDLSDIGIRVNIVFKSLTEVREQHILPKQFDALLYGVQTFLDPDRYELFHSSQIAHPGLNISSYTSKETVRAVVNDTTAEIPAVDDALDDARKVTDTEVRRVKYEIFQKILADEVPVVFLYHPKEAYVVNKRVKNVTLDRMNSLEERFFSVADWEIRI